MGNKPECRYIIINMMPGLPLEQQDECARFLGRFLPQKDFRQLLHNWMYPSGLIVEDRKVGKNFVVIGNKLRTFNQEIERRLG